MTFLQMVLQPSKRPHYNVTHCADAQTRVFVRSIYGVKGRVMTMGGIGVRHHEGPHTMHLHTLLTHILFTGSVHRPRV